MSSRPRGLLFIVSAPSGAGKTTLVEHLVQILPNLRMSRSYTSRPVRDGERDGVDYHFVTRQQFQQMIEERAFLEWADVFGNCYGTSAADTERMLASGQDVVLVIDVQGAAQVKRSGIDHTSIFVLPPSFEILERRLRGRSAAIKTSLMDSRIVVGVGNIYASEALFRAGINPKTASGRISLPRCERLVGAVRETLAAAIEAGGSTLRDFVGADGDSGYFQQTHFVYGRNGEPCRVCGTAVKTLRQGQRATFYCPGCQR